MKYIDFGVLKGKVLSKVFQKGDSIEFHEKDGPVYRLYHDQSCCESVCIEDIWGDLQNLVESPILLAEKRMSDDCDERTDEVDLWTFYEIATIKGSVTIRWHGSSNGYYSVEVDFVEER